MADVVGSTTTGYTRAGSASHAWSSSTRNTVVPARSSSAYVTPVDCIPTPGPNALSSMKPGGVTATTVSVPSRYSTDPSAPSCAMRPSSASGNSKVDGAAADANTIDSFTPFAWAVNSRSTSGTTSANTAVSPDTSAVTASAPSNPKPIDTPSAGLTDATCVALASVAISTGTSVAVAANPSVGPSSLSPVSKLVQSPSGLGSAAARSTRPWRRPRGGWSRTFVSTRSARRPTRHPGRPHHRRTRRSRRPPAAGPPPGSSAKAVDWPGATVRSPLAMAKMEAALAARIVSSSATPPCQE